MAQQTDPQGKWISTGQYEGSTGVPVQLPLVSSRRLYLHAHPSNGGTVWIGPGPTGSANLPDYGYPVGVNDGYLVLEGIYNLDLLWMHIEQAGDKICWLTMSNKAIPIGQYREDTNT